MYCYAAPDHLNQPPDKAAGETAADLSQSKRSRDRNYARFPAFLRRYRCRFGAKSEGSGGRNILLTRKSMKSAKIDEIIALLRMTDCRITIIM
jgi:hypothetical protein